MDSLASKLALIVCEQCKRNEGENDVDFSTRLLSVYNSCYDNIENINKQENNKEFQKHIDSFSDSDFSVLAY